MLISLPVLLARSKRRNTAVACFSVTSVWTMEAVALAVGRTRERAALIVEGSALGGMPLEAVAAYALHAAHGSEGEIALAVRTAPEHADINRALACGIPSLWISRPHHMSEETYIELCQWAAARAYVHGCSLIGESGSPSLPLNPEPMVRDYGVSALGVRLPVMRDGEAVIDGGLVGQAVRKARVPLIGMQAPHEARLRTACAKAGLSGFFYSSETLNEPFGAGLRTGLRDRSQSDPAVYQNPGIKSATEAAVHRILS